ncbi:MAG: helix-turn-helix domain-containing protein [Gammaproteobacteria bacterium]|nr:helix-turn-helix domain-containing protein [Gammaproteobacteria bacterium]MDH5304785.1 helix-turn-helix domain-containing protein [Gammaproteobacteria bacterium]MDH5323063.1 helix-turn-helix domain-containing protein [Gammaproteobacteria bacterium]
MNSPAEIARISAAVQRLREAGVLRTVARVLQAGATTVVAALSRTVQNEVPAFSASRNPDLGPELEAHLAAHLDAVAAFAGGGTANEVSFVLEHARRRAEQKFPLDAELASYRCLHTALRNWLQDAALQSADPAAHARRVVAAVAEFASEYVNAVSTLLTAEYVSHTRSLAEAEGDRRTELFKLLLGGYDESDRRAAQMLRRAGYLEQRQSFCVVVARSVDPREMENAPRAQRMADAVTAAIRNLPLRVLVGIRDNLVTIIVSGTQRLSGWTAPQLLLADRLMPPLRTVGPAALIGVSRDAPSTSHIPAALREAKIALDFASVGSRVVPFAHVPLRDMLVRVASEQLQSSLPAWVAPMLEADRKSRGTLLATLRAYADADMNALKAAAALQRHPNTIYARMQRIHELTGLNPLSFNALTELLLATSCAAADQ